MKLEEMWQEIYPMPAPPDWINPPKTFERYDALVAAYASAAPAAVDAEVFEAAKELFQRDLDRRASIFSRGEGVLPAIGIAVALVSSIGYGFLANRADLAALPAAAQVGMIFCYVWTVWFLVRSGILILKLQGNQVTSKLGPDEVVPAAAMTADAYRRHLTVERLKAVVTNYKATNARMDLLNTAQKNIRNATVAIAVGGVVPVVVWLLGAHHGAPSLGNPY